MKKQINNLDDLYSFIEKDMSMSEFYQPAILFELLQMGGSASKKELARRVKSYDYRHQKEAEGILMNWPRNTLEKSRGILRYDKKTQCFHLNCSIKDIKKVRKVQILCLQKIDAWQSREKQKISAYTTKREELLVKAGGRCQLCGISFKLSTASAHIDHIYPKSKKRKDNKVKIKGVLVDVDDERNLQILCQRCNTEKGNKNKYDWRDIGLASTKDLVRDGVPDKDKGLAKNFYLEKDSALYVQALQAKLEETHWSYIRGVYDLQKSPKEELNKKEIVVDKLVDIVEICRALAKTLGYTKEQFEEKCNSTRIEQGGFDKGTIRKKHC